ncbi:MAG: YkgJ family cysteine cluster protein [Candidatus Altiarchaeota archaeon]|nr:YkgJ family cysteine cluster protein [Candidatus Altiarchaeota archaeon]
MKGVLGEPYNLAWETSFDNLCYSCRTCRTGCCRLYRVPVGRTDLARLGQAGADLRKLLEHDDGRFYLRRTGDGSCVLLKEGLCSAHMVKPRVCNTYPLALHSASNGVLKVDRERVCPPAKSGNAAGIREVSMCVKILVEEYGGFYERQCASYKRLTQRLSSRHPMLNRLPEVETLAESAITHALSKGFHPSTIYQSISGLGNSDGSVPDSENPLIPLKGIFQAGVLALDFPDGKGAVEMEITLKDDILKAAGRNVNSGEIELPSLEPAERSEMAGYLAEISRRGPASQYVIKSLRDERHNDVFQAMACYVFHHACAMAVYLNVYWNIEHAIASHEYGLKKRIDALLS